jgi:DNA-binding SARP family transcriptional activator
MTVDGSARFRILGPLQVEHDDGAVAVGGAKPRTLLAVLLVAGGEVVPADRLVAALWGDSPPPGAATALRAYVSRLRSALDGAATLRHRPPGYSLSLDAATLDAAAFERLVGSARAAAAAGDPGRALADLDTALALWRGDALAEFADDDFATATAARLTELRTSALEDRAAALIALGRPAEAIPELEVLVRRHPSRERPAVVLMEALYATGRQADALSTYHQLRGRLDEELGVEPAAQAQALYRRILLHDPALARRGRLP